MNLRRDDWVAAGLRTLAKFGVEAVRVELLARELGVSKGSFYWHFADRDDLLTAMLHAWEVQNTFRVMARVRTRPGGKPRLLRVFEAVANRVRGGLEAAVRDWARKDERVARRVQAIEQDRLRYLTEVFRESGFSEEAAKWRAETAHLLFLGWTDRLTREPDIRRDARYLAEKVSNLLLTPET